MKKKKPTKDKLPPIVSWKPNALKYYKLSDEMRFEFKTIIFDQLKVGWIIEHEKRYWRILSLHTNNLLKLKSIDRKDFLEIKLTEVKVRFFKNIGGLCFNSNKKGKTKSVTMDFDKLYGKTWSVSGGLPTLGKK